MRAVHFAHLKYLKRDGEGTIVTRIPPHCDHWHDRLCESPHPPAKVLRDSLAKEECVADDIMRSFFDEVAAAIENARSGQRDWEAFDIAHRVVSSNVQRYTLLGPEVARHRFDVALRVVRIMDFQHLMRLQFILSSFCLYDFPDVHDDDFKEAFDDKRQIKLGNDLGIVWITEATSVTGRLGIQEISMITRDQARRVYQELGLVNDGAAPFGAFFVTYRPDKYKLVVRVPRVFDAIGASVFKLVTAPDPECGFTVSLRPDTNGHPEAVHSETSVVPDEWVWLQS